MYVFLSPVHGSTFKEPCNLVAGERWCMPSRKVGIRAVSTRTGSTKKYSIILYASFMSIYDVGLREHGTFIWINVDADLERARLSSFSPSCYGAIVQNGIIKCFMCSQGAVGWLIVLGMVVNPLGILSVD